MQGKAIIFSAPSGAGKTTIVHHLLDSIPELEFSVSACSRPKRANEVHGTDYYFLSIDEFKKRIAEDKFLEWEEVYKDNFYGTLKEEIHRIWAKGKCVIFDVDVVGGLNLKKYFGANALSVFVMAPDIKSLEARLRTRSTESEESIQRRMAKATKEIEYSNQFDKILVNSDLEVAKKEAEGLVKYFLR